MKLKFGLLIAISMLAGQMALAANQPYLLLGCKNPDTETTLKKVLIYNVNGPDSLAVQILSKQNKWSSAEGEFLQYIGSTYRSYEHILARDHEIKITQGHENLFLTMKRDYVAFGAGDIACESKSDGVIQNIQAWKKGMSIDKIVEEQLAGFTMRGSYQNELIHVKCTEGSLGDQATEINLQEYVANLGDGDKQGDSCYATTESEVPAKDRAAYVQAVKKAYEQIIKKNAQD